jgi:hypothetical protein
LAPAPSPTATILKFGRIFIFSGFIAVNHSRTEANSARLLDTAAGKNRSSTGQGKIPELIPTVPARPADIQEIRFGNGPWPEIFRPWIQS